jgi:nitrogen regulation protein NR(I)
LETDFELMDKLLIIDDEADVQYSFRRIFSSPDIQIETADSGEDGLEILPRFKPDLIIMDVRMGGMTGLETLAKLRELDAKVPVIMMTAYGTTQTAIEAMKLGGFDYLLKPFDIPMLKEVVAKALDASRAMKQVVLYEPLLESEDYDVGIIGQSQPMQEVFKMIGQLATSNATALITGESGTGKELVARAVYSHSSRSEQTFLAINCAAIPENLLESELFGHEKGAFTGATSQRIGKFEQCNRGTIFLDEIGDMSLTTQTKILRILQNGTIERVGGNKPVQVDVRVIAATNKYLEEAVANKEFREDLFYRLNVVRILMPPLRERSGDIRLLVNYFLQKFARELAKPVTSVQAEALAALARYQWPGNVRELENVIHRAFVVCKGQALLLGDFPDEVRGTTAPSPATMSGESGTEAEEVETSGDLPALAAALFRWARDHSDLQVIPAVERELIICALKETGGNQVQASKLLGITRATLRKRIEKFDIRQEREFK